MNQIPIVVAEFKRRKSFAVFCFIITITSTLTIIPFPVACMDKKQYSDEISVYLAPNYLVDRQKRFITWMGGVFFSNRLKALQNQAKIDLEKSSKRNQVDIWRKVEALDNTLMLEKIKNQFLMEDSSINEIK